MERTELLQPIMPLKESAVITLKWCIIGLLALCVADYLVARHYKGRYFILHVAANTFISIASLNDLWFVMTDTIGALKEFEATLVPLGLVFSIHFYHMLAPGFKLYYVDWLHHVVMVIFGCPLLVLAKIGPLMNFCFFFICGVPGGYDYFMLVLVKNKVMKPLTEKRRNNMVQVWVRAVALNISVMLLYIQNQVQKANGHDISAYLLFIRAALMLITYWNGNYFMERVCGNYYVTAYKLRETWEKNKVSDPKDRKDLSSMANSEDLRKKVLEDEVDEHPLPDGVQMPGHTRKTKISSMGKIWKYIRVGS